jgi:dienelactone hydrolase
MPRRRPSILALLLLAGVAAHAEPIPVEALTSGVRVLDASLSPDGRHIALVLRGDERSFVAVRDRSPGAKLTPIVAANVRNSVEPRWCRFATNERLVCRFAGTTRASGGGWSRDGLIAIDIDGSKRVDFAPHTDYMRYYLADVVSWGYGGNPRMLTSAFMDPWNDFNTSRQGIALFYVDLATGRAGPALDVPRLMSTFVTDAEGMSVLGSGFANQTLDDVFIAYGKAGVGAGWKLLQRLSGHAHDPRFQAVGVLPDGRDGLMLLSHEGRAALWKVALDDTRDPEPVFWHTDFNVRGVLVGGDGRILGARLETAAIGPWYLDSIAAHIDNSLRAVRPDHRNTIIGTSLDMTAALAYSWGPSASPQYFVVASDGDKLRTEPVGSMRPGLDGRDLARTETVMIPIEGGRLFAQLTLPNLAAAAKAPLVVLVGDWKDDTIEFDPIAKLLASNGYAVLRAQPAQTSRDGRWDFAAYADWSGRIYDGVIASANWAAAHPRIDTGPSCIAGWGYGGFVALLAATRADNGFSCAISVAGFSDLTEVRAAAMRGLGKRVAGVEAAAGRSQTSPRDLADTAHANVLLVHHADNRPDVSSASSSHARAMAGALRRANKPYRLEIVDGARDQFEVRSVGEIIGFLKTALPVAQ